LRHRCVTLYVGYCLRIDRAFYCKKIIRPFVSLNFVYNENM